MKRLFQGSRTGGLLLLLVVTLVAAWGAGALMFSMYMFYDDEGYVLYSYKNYIQHGALYKEVYSQYGPAPYLWYDILHRFLGFPITHEAGRYLTLGIWIGTALGAGVLVRRLTGSLAAAAFTLAATVAYLWPMVSEPSHPGGLIVALTACGALGGAALWLSGRKTAFVVLNGIVAAALALTKINVGAFYILSCFLFMALQGEAWIGRRTIFPLGAVAIVGLPFALISKHLGTPWAVTLACLFAAGGLATFVVAGGCFASRDATEDTPARSKLIFLFIGAGIISSVAIAAAVMIRGSSIADLWNGIVANPFRHPHVFSVKYRWHDLSLPAAVVSMLLFGWVVSRSLRTQDPVALRAAGRGVAIARFVALAGALFVFGRFPEHSPDRAIYSFLHAFLWMALWPLKKSEGDRTWAVRCWLVLVLLVQSLHIYPVPGSQISWGSFLLIPVFVLAWVEAAEWWAENEPRTRGIRTALAGVLFISTGISLASLKGLDSNIKESEPLGLEGTGPIHLPLTSVANYHLLANNTVIHGDMLFTAPGMFSFNMWTGLPTPTLTNVTHWFSLLTHAQQQATISALAGNPRAVVILHREHAAFLERIGFKPKGLLWDYIDRDMPAAFKVGDWEFRVHRGRQVAPFLTGDFLYLPKTAKVNASEVRMDGKLELLVPALPAEDISALEVCCLRRADGTALRIDAANSRTTFQRISLDGTSTTGEQAATLPWHPTKPARLNVHFDTTGYMLDKQRPVIRLLDAKGKTITFVVLRQ